MKNNSKKAIIFFIILLICLAVLGAIGAYIVVKMQTPVDIISEENKTLFKQYVSKNNLNKLSNIDEITEILNKMENSSYELNSNISVITTDNMLGNYDLNKMSLEVQTKNNPSAGLSYADAKFKYATNDIISLQEIKDGNNFAVKSDDIVVKYLGINLENISTFLTKLGLTGLDMLPSDFNALKLGSLLSYDKDLINNRVQLYLKIITDEFGHNNFTLQKNVEVTSKNNTYKVEAYNVILTETEMKNVELAILNDIIQDDDVINILVEKNNLISKNKHTSQSLKELIQNHITELSRKQTSNNQKMKFSIYVYEGNVVKIRCDIYDDFDIEIDLISADNSEEINLTYMKKDRNGFNISLTNKSGKKIEAFYGVISNGEIVKKYEGEFSISGNISSNSIKNNIVLSYKENEKSTTINLENEIKFVDVAIDRLTEENCMFVDRLSDEDFADIKAQLLNQIIKIYKEKITKMDAINRNIQSNVLSSNSDIVIEQNTGSAENTQNISENQEVTTNN